MLADFHPKGAFAESVGMYLEGAGITDRSTLIVDANGVVQHASSVGPGGERDIEELVALCEQVDKDYQGKLEETPAAAGVDGGGKLFVKSNCGFSRAVLLARDNLHLKETLPVLNVSDDANAMKELVELSGKEQAPFLCIGDKAFGESKDIVEFLTTKATGF